MESDAWGELAEFEPTVRKIPLEGWRYGEFYKLPRGSDVDAYTVKSITSLHWWE